MRTSPVLALLRLRYTRFDSRYGRLWSTTGGDGWRYTLPRTTGPRSVFVGHDPDRGRFMIRPRTPRPRIRGTATYEILGPRLRDRKRRLPRSRRRDLPTPSAMRFKSLQRRRTAFGHK